MPNSPLRRSSEGGVAQHATDVVQRGEKDDGDSGSSNRAVTTATTTASTDSSSSASPPAAPSAKQQVVQRWADLTTTLHLACHIVWLQFYLWLGRLYVSFVCGTITSFNRKIAVVGDDMALGVGDWVTLFSYPGIHRRLNDVINKDVVKRAIGRGIFWNAFDAGRSGSMTEDWLPDVAVSRDAAAFKRKWRLVGTRNLFDSLFDPNVGHHRNADVVVLLLGQHDRCDPGETKRMLIKIVVELLRRNKFIIVCTVPNFHRLTSQPKQQAVWRARNQAIRDAVAFVQQTVLSKERFGMLQLADVCERLLPPNFFRFGGAFLSGRGYDLVTRDILDKLTPMMRLVDQDKAILKATPTYSHFR